MRGSEELRHSEWCNRDGGTIEPGDIIILAMCIFKIDHPQVTVRSFCVTLVEGA
ncbi:MAG: hypothetical protein ACI9G5_001341 [Paracoccaceae bacterium]|jgi:hypothetical protein